MALFNSFQFGDVDSKDYGVYISGDSVYDSPARSVDLVQVPGRNGALALDNGYYENIEVTYPAGSFGTSQAEWREKMLGIRNALAAQRGYQRLIDTYHPEHYRLGMFFAGISASPVQYNRAGQFPIRFNCKPQRFLISGDEAVEFTAEGQEEVYGPANIASFEAEEGAEIRQLEVDLEPIQDLNGYDHPWPAGGGKNLLDINNIVVGNTTNWSVDVNGDTLTVAHKTAYTTGTPTFAFNQPSGTYVVSIGSINITGQVSLYVNRSWTKTLSNGDTFTIDAANTNEIIFAAPESQTVIITKIQIETGSSATPYAPYENLCPISGHTEVNVYWTGKNLFDSSALVLKAWNGTGANATRARLENAIQVPVGTRLTFSISSTATYVFTIQELDADYPGNATTNPNYDIITWSSLASYTWTTTHPYVGVLFRRTDSGNITLADLQAVQMQMEVGSTATAYEPYAGQTYNIPLGQTVYGGTLNVTSGVLTVNRAMVTISTLSWIAGTASGRTYFKAAVTGKHVPTSSDTTHPIMATNIEYAGVLTVANMPDASLAQAPGNTEVRIYDSAVTTLSEMLDKYGTGQFVYYLATPTTVQLTPTQVSTLLGQNNIWADAGTVEVTVASPVDLTNPTNFPAKPLIRVYGNGSVQVGNTIATVQNDADGYVDIDCESMNCYDTTGGRNADVSFSGNDFPELASGNNGILLTGPSRVEITPRWWEL